MTREFTWRTVELCEVPLSGATAVAKVEQDDLGVCYWRLNVAEGDRLGLITGGTAPTVSLARIKALAALRLALTAEFEEG
jgi:hypothetical protein